MYKTSRNKRLTRDILLGKSIKVAAIEAGISHSVMCKIFYREATRMGIRPVDTTRFLSQARELVATIRELLEHEGEEVIS